jgi:CheY-like chemotaxis protein
MAFPTQSVWLVDDDEDDLFLMQTALQRAAPSLTIKTLQDGDELLPELVRSAMLPELILLDLNMARMGGLQALSLLRTDVRYDKLPVVVMTTSTNPADRIQSETLGANDFYSKPDQFEYLTQLCRQVVGRWLSGSLPNVPA